MADIYDQHAKAFACVSAFVVLHKGERVATIAFKFPADGARRLYAYVHWLGTEMVRGYAGGYGYDKKTAACADAARKALARPRDKHDVGEKQAAEYTFWAELAKDGGQHWDGALRDAGFTVLQAV
jgi:hypothetical protein